MRDITAENYWCQKCHYKKPGVGEKDAVAKFQTGSLMSEKKLKIYWVPSLNST